MSYGGQQLRHGDDPDAHLRIPPAPDEIPQLGTLSLVPKQHVEQYPEPYYLIYCGSGPSFIWFTRICCDNGRQCFRWQGPDYTEFRKNYVRFIRTPSIEDDPDWEAAPTADPVESPTSVPVSPPADVEVAPLAAHDNSVQDAVLVVASAAVSTSPVVHSVAHGKQQQQQQQVRHTSVKQQPQQQQQQHGHYNKKHEQMYRPNGYGGYDDCRKKQGVYGYAGQDGGNANANYRKQQHHHQVCCGFMDPERYSFIVGAVSFVGRVVVAAIDGHVRRVLRVLRRLTIC